MDLRILFTILLLFHITSVNARRGRKRVRNTGEKTQPCYDENKRPRRCQPSKVDLTQFRRITADSTCGRKSENVCFGDSKGQCQRCDASNLRFSHGAELITDKENPNNKTCWISEPFSGRSKDVSLKMSFGKRFEISFITLSFCYRIPDSLAIYKSVDFGRTWQAFQYYSSDCLGVYGVSPNRTLTSTNQHSALCSSISSGLRKSRSEMGVENNLLAFSTIAHRPSEDMLGDHALLQEWITASDIKIEFRHLYSPNSLPAPAGQKSFYAVSNMQVVGQCQCHGHASECIIDRNGAWCVCSHDTMGTDCQTCRESHQDHPWSRALVNKPYACKECECNSHSDKCAFDNKHYEYTSHRSGGVCKDCKNATVGAHCESCISRFYRASNSTGACSPCNCHEVGSKSMVCNKETGQCDCKEGVMGRACDACLDNYQQTYTRAIPCIKIDPPETTERPKIPGRKCPRKCKSKKKGLHLERFCRRPIAIKGEVISKKTYKDMVRFTVRTTEHFKNKIFGDVNFWVTKTDFDCRCPKLRRGRTYLILTKRMKVDKLDYYSMNSLNLRLNHKSIVIAWKEEFFRRLSKLANQERRGKCSLKSRRRNH